MQIQRTDCICWSSHIARIDGVIVVGYNGGPRLTEWSLKLKVEQMLLPDQVKPLLVHEDVAVRDMAVEYFRQSWSQDPELLPLVFEACRRYGTSECIHLLSASGQFLVTDVAVPPLLDLLAGAFDKETAYRLNRLLAVAPVEVVSRNETAILSAPNVWVDAVGRINRRKPLAGWSGARLWTELQEFGARAATNERFDRIDLGYVEDLLDALGKFDEPSAAAICEQLGAYGPDAGDWLEVFLVDLAGIRRLREAVPILLDKLCLDGDYLLEQSMYALARIGDVEAVRLIRSAWPEATWNFKNYAHNVLGAIKHPESEEAVLALLETETDIGIRTSLCEELCELISERGVAVVRRQIRNGYDRLSCCLERKLLPVAQVLGIELPEAQQWRSERDEQEAQRAERMAELNELGRRWQQAQERQTQQVHERQPIDREIPFAEPIESVTIRNDRHKVGRNDTCPCGSGRKFKKCCARA